MDKTTPGEWLRTHRQRLNMKQEDVARRAGVSTSYVSTIERGQRHSQTDAELRPDPEKLKAIARAVNADPDEFLPMFGYSPEKPLITRRPQNYEEFLAALELLGVQGIHFHENDRLRTAPPQRLQEALDAVRLAIRLIDQRHEDEGDNEPNNHNSQDDDTQTPIRPDR